MHDLDSDIKDCEIEGGCGDLKLIKKIKSKKVKKKHLHVAINLKSHSFWSQCCGQPIWIILISRVPGPQHTSTNLHSGIFPKYLVPRYTRDKALLKKLFRYASIIVDQFVKPLSLQLQQSLCSCAECLCCSKFWSPLMYLSVPEFRHNPPH